MARPLRLAFSGALYHITSRDDRREDIFYNNSDRTLFWKYWRILVIDIIGPVIFIV